MKKLHVGNLSPLASERGVFNAFAAFGPVLKVSILRDRQSGEPRGYAFIEMESDEGAALAIAGLNGTQVEGQTVAVTEAHAHAAKAR